MERTIVRTDRAPAAIGPYSQGVAAGDFVFCAGQIPLDPATGKLVEGSLEDQVRRAAENLSAVLIAAGSGLDRVVRLDVYMTDLSRFPEVNAALARIFPREPPARVTVGVAALPMGASLEMAAVGVRG